MRDTSILSFETNNRIGSTTTTVLPGAHAGYGSVPQTIQKKKDKITVEDILEILLHLITYLGQNTKN